MTFMMASAINVGKYDGNDGNNKNKVSKNVLKKKLALVIGNSNSNGRQQLWMDNGQWMVTTRTHCNMNNGWQQQWTTIEMDGDDGQRLQLMAMEMMMDEQTAMDNNGDGWQWKWR